MDFKKSKLTLVVVEDDDQVSLAPGFPSSLQVMLLWGHGPPLSRAPCASPVRDGNRSIRSYSGWTAPEPASISGSVQWSITPSSGCGRQEIANRTDQTLSGWGLASDSGGHWFSWHGYPVSKEGSRDVSHEQSNKWIYLRRLESDIPSLLLSWDLTFVWVPEALLASMSLWIKRG